MTAGFGWAYPPGCSGFEYELAGPDWEDELTLVCPDCGQIGVTVLAQGYRRERWICDGECRTGERPMTTTLTRKRRGFSRDDVATHYDRERRPAVNVKCSIFDGDYTDAVLLDVGAESIGTPTDFLTWWRATEDRLGSEPGTYGTAWDDFLYRWWEVATSNGWEDLQNDAEAVFPDHSVTVEQEGRSGGWAVLAGLPDLDDWDAVLIGRYRRFARFAAGIVADIPRAVAWLIMANVYESEVEEYDDACAIGAALESAAAGRMFMVRAS